LQRVSPFDFICHLHTGAAQAKLMSARRKTILLVDDEDSPRWFARAALRSAQYGLLEATSYDRAMSVYDRHPTEVDLLLVDISMPEKSGLDLARALLILQPDLKVLYMSGRAGAVGCQFYGVAASGESFLEKPFHPAELLQKVNDLIGPASEPLVEGAST
jgi:DNA-binding response OmpR family regulator